MICCMPFTYLSEANFELLHTLSDHLVVYQPAAYLLNDNMGKWVEKGALNLRAPENVDTIRLKQVFNEFRVWADLHQGDIADIAGYYKSNKGQPPLVKETDPTQIGTQLKRFGQNQAENNEDSLFQACLFLFLAHDYDAQRDLLTQALRSVEKNEQEMFHGLAGNPDEHDDVLEIAGTSLKEKTKDDPGAYMTDRRIQAWATVAGHLPEAAWAYITTSRAVFDNLCDRFADTAQLLRCTIGLSDRPKLDTLLKEIAFKENLKSKMGENTQMGDEPERGAQLTLCGLADCAPCNALSILSPKHLPACPSALSQAPVNTLFGYLSPGENASI